MKKVIIVVVIVAVLGAIGFAAVQLGGNGEETGPATVETLASYCVGVDLCPERHLAQGMLQAFAAQGGVSGKRFLLVRPAVARQVVPEGLRKLGGVVQEVVVYRTVRAEALQADALRKLRCEEIDLVTLTSSSTAMCFADLLGPERTGEAGRGIRVACIGPETSRTARKLGFRVVVEPDADDISVPGLVRAIVAHTRTTSVQP